MEVLPSRAAVKGSRTGDVLGRNSTASQILNPGIRLGFGVGETVVGYVRRNSWLLVAGEPVCPLDALPAAVEEFGAAGRAGPRSLLCLASDSLRDLFAGSADHSIITMGAQPVWHPADWPGIVRTRSSLRAQLHRSLNKGVRIERMNPGDGARDAEIGRTLSDWLASRRLPPMHFMVEPDVLSGVTNDRLLFVARREGRIVAFLVASPVVARNGYLIEELARSPRAPNGTAELLIDAAMGRFTELGCTYVTMGLVALASGTVPENPLWLRSLMYIARAHANRFYNFRGLERFRAKMHPAYWEKIYAISNERRFSPQALYRMGGAAGMQTFQIRNSSTGGAEVDLINPANDAIYAEVAGLGPGTTRPMRVDLGSGRYAFRCLLQDTDPLTGPAVRISGHRQGARAILPVTTADLLAPARTYHAYVAAGLDTLVQQVSVLSARIRAGRLGAARAAWLPAHLTYERLGAAYGTFGNYDTEIDGRPDGLPRVF